jgi:hypothetical protein
MHSVIQRDYAQTLVPRGFLFQPIIRHATEERCKTPPPKITDFCVRPLLTTTNYWVARVGLIWTPNIGGHSNHARDPSRILNPSFKH